MNNLLINYPHGLGDCIMFTPTMRQYYMNTGNKLNLIMLERLKTAQLFENCPYVGKIFYVKDPWHDYKGGFGVGKVEEMKAGRQIAKDNKMTFKHIEHPAPNHKIHINARELNLKLDSEIMDVFISDADRNVANLIINNAVGKNKFGFVQTITTGGKVKDLPNDFGKKWLKKNRGIDHVIEVGKDFKYDDYNINVQFEIMRRASAICIPDSVFYHAASAMGKNIDFVFFGRGTGVYVRVKNLNPNVNENVVYKIF